MGHTPGIVAASVILALAAMRPATAQQFELRVRGAAPALPALLALNGGIAVDIDQSGGMDVLQKGGSALIDDGNLGYSWSPPGARVPSIGGIPNFFDLAADVDGDNRPELVFLSASFFALNSDVFVNPGLPGGFWAPRAVAGTVNGLAQSTLLRDIDADGFPDLLYRRFWPKQENGLLRNQGNGTFVDVSASHLPAIPMDAVLALGDTTGDGVPDLVVRSNGVLQFLKNNGAGLFRPVASGLPAVTALQALYLDDADADGDRDLLVALAPGSPLQLWLNVGNGAFTAAVTTLPAAGTGHAFADLDADQRADLVLIENTPLGQQLRVRRNVGGSQFLLASSALVDAVVSLGEPVLADLESDGDLDAIVGGGLFFLHDGNLGFSALQRHPLAETAIEDSVVVGDLDGDEFDDLVVGDTLHHNQGDGWFTNVGAVLPTGARAQALADLDNDGDLDLVWTRATATAVDGGVMVNHLGALTASTVIGGGLLRGRVEATDFDNDGWIDLVSEGRRVLRNLGGMAFVSVATFNPVDRLLTTGDFDADGLTDIVTTQSSSWTLWRNVGNHVFQPTTSQAGGLTAATPGDFDGDGRLDLATSYSATVNGLTWSFLRVWFQPVSGWLAGSAYQDGGETIASLAAADFNGDGAVDLVGRSVWTNDGTGQLLNASSGVQFSSALAVTDLDNDRDLDIVRAANSAAGNARRPYVFVNRRIDLDADRLPVLGRPYTITMASRAAQGVGGDLVVIALALTRIAPLAVPSLGLLQVDPQSIVATQVGSTASSGLCTLPFGLPLQPALAGMEVYWQGAAVGAQGLRLTGLLIDRLLL